ncbi:UNVERIFIED_CONTAM: hypothetical protein Sindi_0801400 [Sesamum indicum]
MPKYYNWTSHGKERVQEYFDVITALSMHEEQTIATALCRTYTSLSPPPPPRSNMEDRMMRLETMIVDMMNMMKSIQTSASIVCPSQPPVDPRALDDEEMDHADKGVGI